MSRTLRYVIFVLVMVAGLWILGAWYRGRNASSDAEFRTAPVKRGDLVAHIGATGTIQPEEVINVGAQVAGRIMEFGKDKAGKVVDYGSEITENSVLALIDPAVYQSEVDSAEAQLAQAKAGVDRAVADAAQFEARYNQAERDWKRAQKLGPSDALAQVDYDNYQSAYEAAKANVGVAKASIEQAKRTVAAAQASLDRAKRNLTFCTITSPVNGVIIDRRVNIGQTVVSSLSAPSLFLIAKDLRRMMLWVAVNEADIGSIKPGQPVTFSVDAFPGRSFRGTVHKVRLNASMTSNVVTYTVEVSTDNSSNTLLPYLTANVQFEVDRRDDVFSVPNAALRFSPTEEQMAPDVRETFASASTQGDAQPSGRRRERSTTRKSEEHDQPKWREGVVWVRNGNFARPIHVRAGLTDGASTEVASPDLKDDMEVITAAVEANSRTSEGQTNPFAPPRMGGSRSGSGRSPRL